MLKLKTLGFGVALSGALGGAACMDAGGGAGSGPEEHQSPLVSVSYEDVVGGDGLFMPLPADVTLTATNVAVFACLSADACREWTLELRPEAIEPGDVIEVCVAGKCFEPASLEILRHGRAAPTCEGDSCGLQGFPNYDFLYSDGREARVVIMGVFAGPMGGAIMDLNDNTPGTFDVVTDTSGIQICVAGNCFEGGAPRAAEAAE